MFFFFYFIFEQFQKLIISALTDVWSAIRNSCAKGLGPIVSHLSLVEQEKIFQELVKVIHNI